MDPDRPDRTLKIGTLDRRAGLYAGVAHGRASVLSRFRPDPGSIPGASTRCPSKQEAVMNDPEPPPDEDEDDDEEEEEEDIDDEDDEE